MDEVHSVSLFGEITCLNAHGADVFVFTLDTLHAFKTRDPYFGLMQNDCSDHKSIISKMLLKVKFALLAAANQAMHLLKPQLLVAISSLESAESESALLSTRVCVCIQGTGHSEFFLCC